MNASADGHSRIFAMPSDQAKAEFAERLKFALRRSSTLVKAQRIWRGFSTCGITPLRIRIPVFQSRVRINGSRVARFQSPTKLKRLQRGWTGARIGCITVPLLQTHSKTRMKRTSHSNILRLQKR